MKRLISAHVADELDILQQIRDYWEIQKDNFGFENKEDCKHAVLEYLQFINVDIDQINKDIDEIVDEVYLQTKAAML